MRAEVPPEQLPPPGFDGRDVAEQMDRILARPEFQEPPVPLLDRLVGWVFERISDAIGALAGDGRGSLVAWAVVIGGAAVILYVIARAARRWGHDNGGRVVARGEDEVGRPAHDWRREAEGHETRGEWRRALRCRYRALVAELAARGLVEEVPGRTAGEYRREVVANLPAAMVEFGSATELFEQAWYGHRDTDVDEVDRFRALSDQVLAGAPS